MVANICLAFLEPTISKWMHETMDAEEWQQVRMMLLMMKMEENIIAIGITLTVSRLMQKKATQKALIGQSLK